MRSASSRPRTCLYPVDKRARGNRAKHLVRVATEYTQLLYHVSKAQADTRSAFVDEIQWVCKLSIQHSPPLTGLPLQRISRVQSTLSSDLDHLFSDTLTALSSSKLAETDKAKRMADLTECLRTYDALQLWRDAEDVLRRVVFREFVKKVFHKQLNCDFVLNCVTHYFVGHLPWRAPSPTFPICPSNTIPNTR